MTSLIGFNEILTNIDTTLKQCRDKVVSTLFQRCSNVRQQCCNKVVQRWKYDVKFCFIFNVGSTLFQADTHVETTLIQRWNVGWDNF